MGLVFGLIAALGAILALAFALARMKTRSAAQTLRVVLGLAGLVLGALLTLRGLAAAGLPLLGASLGLLGVALRGGQAARGGDGASAGARRPSSGRMSRRDAAEVLGVSPDASEAEINKAYRDLMKKVHPDAGGDDALAARVQEAREVLLGKR